MEKETIWKICPIAPFFEVASNGDVRSITRRRIISPEDNWKWAYLKDLPIQLKINI